MKPVISPAPFSTAPPAGTSSRGSSACERGTTAVIPVRATPRPSGGSGSSRQTVTWPTVTPATSVIAFAGPVSKRPMRRPSSRSRGLRCFGGALMRASVQRRQLLGIRAELSSGPVEPREPRPDPADPSLECDAERLLLAAGTAGARLDRLQLRQPLPPIASLALQLV